jgi:hypothetical protein
MEAAMGTAQNTTKHISYRFSEGGLCGQVNGRGHQHDDRMLPKLDSALEASLG